MGTDRIERFAGTLRQPLGRAAWVKSCRLEPSDERILWAERHYRRALERARAKWARTGEVARQIFAAGGSAHCQPTHRALAKLVDPWWVYTVDERAGWWNEWCRSRPSEPLNLALGQRLYDLERLGMRANSDMTLARGLLEELLLRRLGKFDVPQRQTRVEVAGRAYWFDAKPNSAGVVEQGVLSWPEHDAAVVRVGLP